MILANTLLVQEPTAKPAGRVCLFDKKRTSNLGYAKGATLHMTKTDYILLDLRRVASKFVESVLPFEYKNKVCRLVNSYVASPWTRCNVCGHHPIKNVFVVRCSDGQRLRVGSSCIDRITGLQISELFEKFRIKRENIISNRRYIDGLASILTAHKNNELSFQKKQ